MDNQEQSKNTSESTKQSEEVLGLIADWVKLYAGNYGKEPTEETVLAYRIGLLELKPKLLHKAFLRCLRECSFWPTVAEVREAYAIERHDVAPFPTLPAHEEEVMTAEEAKHFVEQVEKTLANLPPAWGNPKEDKHATPIPIFMRTPESDERVRQQIEQLKQKYPDAFKERSTP